MIKKEHLDDARVGEGIVLKYILWI